jgi:hypothetical protein
LTLSCVHVATAPGAIELSSQTLKELTKRLGRMTGSGSVAATFEAAGPSDTVALNEQDKRRVFDELTFWLDNPGPSGFPDDARALFRALAKELTDLETAHSNGN